MLRTVVHLLLRIAGWLLTPIAATLAAALGATIGAMVAPTLSPTSGLVATGIGALAGASLGLWLWLRLVRSTPELQDALAVTPDGVPTEAALDEFVPPSAEDEPRP